MVLPSYSQVRGARPPRRAIHTGTPVEQWQDAAKKFHDDFGKIQEKIHRFPASLRLLIVGSNISLRDLGSRYIVPAAVAIGPYHHGLKELQEMEKVKRVAAHHFISDKSLSYEETHGAVRAVAGAARSLYADDDPAVAGIDDAELADMMFLDGCFLMQYMFVPTDRRNELPDSLLSCFVSNDACISSDIMLLENQIPWVVIRTLMSFRPDVPLGQFVGRMGRTFQVHMDAVVAKEFVYDAATCSPPHVLGLLRSYKTGKSNGGASASDEEHKQRKPMSKNISAIEFAEIGIRLAANETAEFMNMGFKGRPMGSLSLAPLLLDNIRSCWLVNMAAFEVCLGMATGHQVQDLAVCSYILVLAMLMDREEDVHVLRTKRLVQGELTNKETLDFFKTIVKHVSGGPLYTRIMEDVESYRRSWCAWIKLHQFLYNNYKNIIALLSGVGVLVGLFKTLLSLKQH